MPQQHLSLSTLGLLNNGLASLVGNAALQAALADCADRGDDGKPRKAVLAVVFLKRPDGQIEVGFEAGVKMPPYKTADTVAEVETGERGRPRLLFRDDSPMDPRQKTVRDYLPPDDSEVPNE